MFLMQPFAFVKHFECAAYEWCYTNKRAVP